MSDQTQSTYLTTKVTILKETHIMRERLLESLHTGINGRLTLISAPAGFGKTTLLAQWAHTALLPCV